MYQVEVQVVAPQFMAVVRDHSTLKELPGKIYAHCSQVWKFLKSAGLQSNGHNIAFYGDPDKKTMTMTGQRFPIEVGAQVVTTFANTGNEKGDDAVVCSATPGGTVAMTAHWGPYDRLYEAHEALLKWCAEHNRVPAGPNWEVYGHWEDDPGKLRTDVYYLLRETDAA